MEFHPVFSQGFLVDVTIQTPRFLHYLCLPFRVIPPTADCLEEDWISYPGPISNPLDPLPSHRTGVNLEASVVFLKLVYSSSDPEALGACASESCPGMPHGFYVFRPIAREWWEAMCLPGFRAGFRILDPGSINILSRQGGPPEIALSHIQPP
jgi:hypothetical protein